MNVRVQCCELAKTALHHFAPLPPAAGLLPAASDLICGEVPPVGRVVQYREAADVAGHNPWTTGDGVVLQASRGKRVPSVTDDQRRRDALKRLQRPALL